MNSQEFIEEVKCSSLRPDDFDKIYNKIAQYQELARRSLRVFHDICERSGVRYQLAFGSLLGAIRDGGQIPWDYDIDVFVPFEDRNNLIDALKKMLPDDYYFDCAEINPKCRNEMIRVTPKGYRSEVLHVDVFFLAGTPDDTEQFEEHTKQIRELCNKRFEILVNLAETYKGHPKSQLLYAWRKLSHFLHGEKAEVLHNEYIELCKTYSIYSSDKAVNANGFAGKYYLPSEHLRETKLIVLEDGTFRVPVNYDPILKQLFGDYMKVLPLQKRLAEMQKSYEFIKTYEDYKPVQ